MERILPLLSAHPYIRLFRNRVFVIKLSGSLLEEERLRILAADIALLVDVGIRVVLVHGGGPQLDALCAQLGVERQVVGGRRVTDAKTQELARMVFRGALNSDVVSALGACGIAAVGLSGGDGRIVQGVRRPPRPQHDPATGEERMVDFGLVGDIESVDTGLLLTLLDRNNTPVVCPLITGPDGQLLNVNADTVAARLAMALGAEKLILCTAVPGLLEDVKDPRRLVSYGDLDTVEDLIGRGAISGGMLPKIAAIREALQGDVRRVHIIDGTRPHSLLLEIFTNEGCGTMLVRRRDDA